MMYLGIDNGISGALVLLGHLPGPPIAKLVMPTKKARQGNEVDVRAIDDWLHQHTSSGTICAILEEPGGSKSAKAAKSMAGSFHAIRALLELRGIRWERITPAKWQKPMLPGAKPGETKPRALEASSRLWPDENWLATERSRKPHDGLIDAALIAEYARRNHL